MIIYINKKKVFRLIACGVLFGLFCFSSQLLSFCKICQKSVFADDLAFKVYAASAVTLYNTENQEFLCFPVSFARCWCVLFKGSWKGMMIDRRIYIAEYKPSEKSKKQNACKKD